MSKTFDTGTRQRAEARLHSVIGTALVLLIVVMVNFLAFRHYERWDWTSEARYTLSERSREVIAGLERDAKIILLLSEGEEQFDDVRELMVRYGAEGSRLTVEQIDPDREPQTARQIAEQYNIRMQATSEGTTLSEVAALVILGDESRKIRRDDLIHVGLADNEEAEVDIEAERTITGALVELVEGRTTKVCVTTGHGEWTVGSGERSLSFLRDELERENTEVIPLASDASLDECDAVFVLGPQRALQVPWAQELVDYAAEGGHLLLALDPIPDRQRVRATGFERALAAVGVLIDPSILVESDPQRLLGGDPTDQVMLLPQPHPTTMPALATGGPFLTSIARTVRGEGSDVITLLEGSAVSFGKTDIRSLILDADVSARDGDIAGPATVGVAREFLPESGDAPPGRLVVVGDSDWLSDRYLAEPSLANRDVLMATTGWLTEREAMISVPARTSRLRAVMMSDADISGLWARVMIFLPGAFALLGFAVWWSRRQ